jgi:large subunit ribosomal protein L6
MSRIGKRPIDIPGGVAVTQTESVLAVKGPKGELSLTVHPELTATVDDGVIRIERPSDSGRHRALHGLTRTLVANMVTGVTTGFSKTLEIVGVGYRAEKKGDHVTFSLGYSHPVHFQPPEGIDVVVPNPTTVTVSGADKQAVGQVAADIRSFRPPEPYKGKGIRYQGEQVRRKAGKTAGS